MTTIRKIIKGSLRLINAISANEEPSADDTDITLRAFNGLIDNLGNDVLNIYTFTPYRFLLSGGKESYLLGPEFDAAGDPTGADWITERPMRIEQVKVMLYPNVSDEGITGNTNTLYLPCRNLTMSEYASVRLRNLPNQWPNAFYDSGSFPTRKLSFWPVPNQSNAVEIWMWEPLTVYSNLDEELNLPPGYERYFRFKLAVEIAPEFGKELSATVLSSMAEAEANIKKLNQSHPRGSISSQGSTLSPGGKAYVDNYSIGFAQRSSA